MNRGRCTNLSCRGVYSWEGDPDPTEAACPIHRTPLMPDVIPMRHERIYWMRPDSIEEAKTKEWNLMTSRR